MENTVVEKKKSKKIVIIFIIGLLIILAIGLGVYFLFFNKSRLEKENTC